jgi:TIGR02678 family protein
MTLAERSRPSSLRPAPAPRASLTLPDDLAAERRRAIRVLLASPLLVAERADPEDFAAVRRHFSWLRDWFAERTGWRLTLDGRAGVARLFKQVGDSADQTRGAVVPGASRRDFARRTYVLFCLACAELDQGAARQVLVSTLAHGITLRSAAEGIPVFDPTEYRERQGLVDALRALEALGVLRLTDGDLAGYLDHRGEQDGLYTIDRDRMARLVATNSVPSLAPSLEVLLAEPRAETTEARVRRTRHRLLRRLLDDPVVYEADLDEDELTYLRTQRVYIAATLDAAGLELERRAEGAAGIDRTGELSDQDFPATGTLGHATLLVAEYLTELAREAPNHEVTVARPQVVTFVSGAIERHRLYWSKARTDIPGAATRMTDAVTERLVASGLVRLDGSDLVPLAAIARYASTELDALAVVGLDLDAGPDALEAEV